MHFDVNALPTEQAFDAWVDTTRQNGPVLDQASMRRWRQQSHERQAVHLSRRPIRRCSHQIVTQLIPPAEGPPADTPKRDVSPHSQ